MDEWIKKMWYNQSYLAKEGNPVMGCNKNEPWGHYAKWNKPATEGKKLDDSIYMRYLK